MDLLQLLNELVAKLADAQKAADDLAKSKYDEGFAAGVASVGSDKIYSQAELDAAVVTAVEPLQAQVNALSEQVSALQGQMDQKVAEAVAAIKADLLAKYKELEVAIQEKETGFEELLK